MGHLSNSNCPRGWIAGLSPGRDLRRPAPDHSAVKFCRYRQFEILQAAFAPFRMTPLRKWSATGWTLIPPYLCPQGN